jgi:hypothetical protein
MFPVLEPKEIERLVRFGEGETYMAGERMVVVGKLAPRRFHHPERPGRRHSTGSLGHPELIATHSDRQLVIAVAILAAVLLIR